MVKITFVKIGNITLTTLVDIMIDERGSREDIEATVISSSTKLQPSDVERLFPLIDQVKTDLMIMISPNANLKGPQKLIDNYQDKYPLLVISDAADKDLRAQWRDKGIGYLIAPFDPMIGAKKDFLDPSEMCLFNGHIISCFSATGVFSYFTNQIDEIINMIKNGEELSLPTKYLSSKEIVTNTTFSNDFSKPKAYACLEMLAQVGKLNVSGLYVEKDEKVALLKVGAAHEMVRQANLLSDEIREMEKAGNHLAKYPHAKDGSTLHKMHYFDEAHK